MAMPTANDPLVAHHNRLAGDLHFGSHDPFTGREPTKKYKVTLTPDERLRLHGLIAAGKGAAKKLAHARILLKADAAPYGAGWSDGRIADTVEVSPDTVARVRERFVKRQDRVGLAVEEVHRPVVEIRAGVVDAFGAVQAGVP